MASRSFARKLVRFVRRVLHALHGGMVLGACRIAGPPNVLLYSSDLNARILRAFGASVARDVRILPPLVLSHVRMNGYRNLSIGSRCILGGNVFLDLRARVRLCDGVSLGPGVTIMTHNRYNMNPFLEERLAGSCGIGDVTLEENASVKAGALIVHGITVGKNAVVAGHAVVNRDVPDCCFVGGIPAKTIKVLT
jgi:maltose O-acetyltransferase